MRKLVMLVMGQRLKEASSSRNVSSTMHSCCCNYLGRESGAREGERGHGAKDGKEGEDSGEHFDYEFIGCKLNCVASCTTYFTQQHSRGILF